MVFNGQPRSDVSATAARKGGAFWVFVGPDGVGKTSLAREIVRRMEGRAVYFHFCPPILGRWPSVSDPQHPTAKFQIQGSPVLGWIRLLRNFVRFWIAFQARIRPKVKRGSLVIGDRWAYGYVGQPASLRFYGPNGLARIAVRLFPRPDHVFLLTGEPSVIHSRKQELSVAEIGEEFARWDTIGIPVMKIDTSDPIEVIAGSLLEYWTKASGGEGFSP